MSVRSDFMKLYASMYAEQIASMLQPLEKIAKLVNAPTTKSIQGTVNSIAKTFINSIQIGSNKTLIDATGTLTKSYTESIKVTNISFDSVSSMSITLLWISEVVEFIAEWRCFVLDGRVLDVRPYTCDYHAQFDPSVIDKAISCWKDAPIAYGLDIGVTSDGRTLVVEVNDGYELGNYGLSPLNSINFHKARWKEMVKPYFEKTMSLLCLK